MSKQKKHEVTTSKAETSTPQVFAFSRGAVSGYVVDHKAHMAQCSHPTPHRDSIVRFLKTAVSGK